MALAELVLNAEPAQEEARGSAAGRQGSAGSADPRITSVADRPASKTPKPEARPFPASGRRRWLARGGDPGNRLTGAGESRHPAKARFSR